MEFWFSGEIDHRFGEEYRQTKLRVVPRLNSRFGDRDYGDEIILMEFAELWNF